MTIQIANNALENCNSIEEVVELINDETLTDASAEMIAAAYAIDSAELDIDIEYEIEAHLDELIERGAKFDFIEALEMTIIELIED